jgi:hypothetical protein
MSDEIYPTDVKERVRFWLGQIAHSRAQVAPLFDACDILAKQFFNEATTDREENESPYTSEDHVRRTKSGIVYAFIDQSQANMFDRNPVFDAQPETPEAAAPIDPDDPGSLSVAQGTAKIINYRYRETNQLSVDERVSLDAWLFPYGVAKIGHTVDLDEMDIEIRALAELIAAKLKDAEATLIEAEDDPEDENIFLTTDAPVEVVSSADHSEHIDSHKAARKEMQRVAKEAKIEISIAVISEHIKWHRMYFNRMEPSANSNVRYNAPFAVHWPADMFLTDDLSREGPQDARWIAFQWELPKPEVLANPLYVVKDPDKLVTFRREGASDITAQDSEIAGTDGFDMVRGWEVWARGWAVERGQFRDLVFTLTEDAEDFLSYEETWPYDRLDDYPVETVVYQTGLRKWFHKPPLLLAGGDTVQALLNEILDSYLHIIRKQKNLWLIDPAAGFKKADIQNILDLPDGSVVEIQGLAENGGERAIIPLPFHQIPPEKGDMVAVLTQMFDRAAGTPQPVRGPSEETATEVSINERRNTARENRRAALVGEFQVRKARKMWQLDAQFRPDKLFLIDRDAHIFLPISAEMATGEYLLSMEISSQVSNIATERSQWLDLLNLLAGLTPLFMQIYKMPPNLAEVARRLLVRGFRELDIESILPMLKSSRQSVEQLDGVGGGAGLVGADGQPIARDELAPSAISDPIAQALQAGVGAGRTGNGTPGPLDPERFNRDVPSDGRLAGAAQRNNR